jgi:CHAD domain-containing protein
MLTKKIQRRWLTEKEQRWLKELVVFDESRDEKALHRLRLEIKKIRALVELAKAQSGKRASGHLRGLKEMFRQAGVIRDAGSQVRYLEERHLLSPEFRERQTRSIGLAGDEFAGHIRQFRRKGKKASKRIRMEVQSIHAGRIQQWYAREIIRTGILLTGSVDPLHGPTGGDEGYDPLHEARKKIKTLLYVQKLLPVEIAERIRLNTDYLDQLQEAIGQWHDAMMAMAGWAKDDIAGELVMRQECLDRERTALALADRFCVEAHLA